MTSPSERSQWPLWVMLWCFENDSNTYPEPSNELCHTLMMTWLSLTKDEDRCRDFQSTLFNAQLNTDRLLREWLWWLVYTKVNVLSDNGLGILSKHWDQSAYGTAEEPRRLVEQGDSKKYSKCLSHLLWSEFAPVKASAVSQTKLLQLARKDCAIHAACMRVARECLLDTSEHDLADGSCGCADVGELSRGWPTSASALINACPWLEFETSAYQLPHYLWDLDQRATVEVSSIEYLDRYIAISHTWGRWQKRKPTGEADSGDFPFAKWPIPKNERFDVGALPEILEPLRDQTRYVWLDLLCIPQDHSDLAVLEIARQGAIFRNAARCICWMADVDGWAGVRSAVAWMSRQYLLQYNDGTWPSDLPAASQDDPSLVCELVLTGQDFYRDGKWSPEDINPWFTSLWTLQEVCIRADMILCDRTFVPCTIGTASFPVTVADISALIYMVRSALSSDEPQLPVAVRQLFDLWAATGLHHIFKLSRAMIMQLGNSRQCSGEHPEARAEAIMSAMGVVDWFLPFKDTTNEDKRQSLILDVYPLPFVEELRTKGGSGSFFSDATMDFEMLLKAFYFDDWLDHIRVVGSILPFGPGVVTNTTDMSIFNEDVPCTRSWALKDNGSVQISRAFIQSSSGETTSNPFMCTWFGPDEESSDLRLRFWGEQADLNLYLRQYKPDRRNYAVAITRASRHVQGILLKELAAGVLIKIGDYTWYPPQGDAAMIGQEVDVDWTVL